MPGIEVIAVDVLDYAFRKLDQGKAEEGPLRIGGPVHIASAGLLTARATGVQAARTSIGVGDASIGRNPPDTAAAQPGQRLIGGCAVGPVNGVAALGADPILAGVASLCHDFFALGSLKCHHSLATGIRPTAVQ